MGIDEIERLAEDTADYLIEGLYDLGFHSPYRNELTTIKIRNIIKGLIKELIEE